MVTSRAEALDLGNTHYYTGVACSHGHFCNRLANSGRCTECASNAAKAFRSTNKSKVLERESAYRKSSKSKRAESRRRHYNENREQILAKSKEYREANKQDISDRNKRKRLDNIEHYRARARGYYRKNREQAASSAKKYRESNKEKISLLASEYHKNNPMNKFTRDSLQRIEKATGYDRIQRAEVELGYSQSDFTFHIESMFSDGMGWHNRSEWHIDHIKPIAQFLKEGVTDVAVINSLSNLQPLWAKENQSKGSNWAKNLER